jgi:hypothetical protein
MAAKLVGEKSFKCNKYALKFLWYLQWLEGEGASKGLLLIPDTQNQTINGSGHG